MTTASAALPSAPTASSSSSSSLSPDEARAFYPDDMTLREARARYFARSGFNDATYTERFVHLPAGPFTIVLPNLAARRRAVRIHDLNHILTGYGTAWDGEGAISAFELGMGMGPSWMGWMINAGGTALGLLRWPASTLAAFARGRATSASTYRLIHPWDDRVLDERVGTVRAQLGLVDSAPVRTSDIVRAVVAGTIGIALHLLPFAIVAAVAAFFIWR